MAAPSGMSPLIECKLQNHPYNGLLYNEGPLESIAIFGKTVLMDIIARFLTLLPFLGSLSWSSHLSQKPKRPLLAHASLIGQCGGSMGPVGRWWYNGTRLSWGPLLLE